MPYIKQNDRDRLISWLMDKGGAGPKHSGELNYVLTYIIHCYLDIHGKRYQTMNDIVGALDNCKDEFRRRVQHPYEDEKIEENGDV